MRCTHCTADLPDNAKFCLECGSNISALSTVSVQEPPGVSMGDLRTIGSPGGEGGPERSVGEMRTMTGPGGGTEATGPGHTALSERYELLDEIGRGGFAKVWKARDRKLGRVVAVKRLQENMPRGALGEQTLARFRREAQAIAQLNHRNIVAVYDHDRDEEGDYIVMECVEGGTLRDFLKARGGRLEVPEAVEIVRGIAQGLAYAHRKNLVHRDIKPSNILLQRDPSTGSGPAGDELTPKIVDFGLARAGSESELSMTGYGMGTPWYMPPEQRRDAKSVNHTADIYALGKVLYELVSGETPDNIDPEKIPALPGLSEIVFKCIKSNPEERYFSAEEVIKALQGIGGVLHATGTAAGRDGAHACPACGMENGEGVKFCEGCGAGLTRACPECERENSVHRQYCGGCGTDVEGFLKWQQALQEMRKHRDGKRWGRMAKEYGLLSGEVRMQGKRGTELRGQVEALHKELRIAQTGIDRLEKEAQAARTGGDWHAAARALAQLRELNPQDESVAGQLGEALRMADEEDWRKTSAAAIGHEGNQEYDAAVKAYRDYLALHMDGIHAVAATDAMKAAERQMAVQDSVKGALDHYAAHRYRECAATCTKLVADGDFNIDAPEYHGTCSELLEESGRKATELDGHLNQMRSMLGRRDWTRVREAAQSALAIAPGNAMARKGRQQAMTRISVRRNSRILMAALATVLLVYGVYVAASTTRQQREFGRRAAEFDQVLGAGNLDRARELAADIEAYAGGMRFSRTHAPAIGFLGTWQERATCDALRRIGMDLHFAGTEREDWQRATAEFDRADALLAVAQFDEAGKMYVRAAGVLRPIVRHGSIRVTAEVPEYARTHFAGVAKRVRVGSGEWQSVRDLPMELGSLPCEEHEVLLEAEGYQVQEGIVRVSVADGETVAARFSLVPEPARVTVHSATSGAAVYDAAGNRLGAAGTVLEVPSLAAQQLVVRAARHQDKSLDIRAGTLLPGGAYSRDVSLEESHGSIRVTAEVPEYARTHFAGVAKRVRVGSGEWQSVRDLPLDVDGLACEEHEVLLEAEGYRVQEGIVRVNVADGEIVAARFSLVPEPARVTVHSATPGAAVYDAAGNRLGAVGTAVEVPSLVAQQLVVRAARHQDKALDIRAGSLQPGGAYRHEVAMEEMRGPVAGRNARIADLGLDLIWVEAGSFRMGSASGGDNDERPVREVRITRGFWMGKTEVTQAQYESLTERNPSHFKGANLPVEMVSWNDAVRYCELLTERERRAGRLPEGYVYRLPTEAEWEYAARGGRQGRDTTYAGSNTIGDVAWHSGNSGIKTHPVGTKAANELGLHDMSGNVWEWVHDWYQNSYSGLSTTDPTGPGSGSSRVNRGGGWGSTATGCRVAARSINSPSGTRSNLGFRVVLAAPVQ